MMKKAGFIGGLIALVLTGLIFAQQSAGVWLTMESGLITNSQGSLFREGIEVSHVARTFAGPVCAKGRIVPEWEDFFDGSGRAIISSYAGHGTIEYDSRKIEGTQSTKINVTRDSGAAYFKLSPSLSPPLDLRGKSIKFRFYVPAESNIKIISLVLQTPPSKTIMVWARSSRSPRTGWIDYTLTQTNTGTVSDGYNPGSISNFTIAIERVDYTQPAYILVNGITVWDGRLKMPLYCCTFDDNYIRQKAAAEYALSKGIPVSLFINKNFSDGRGVADGTVGMTLEQNQALEKAGCIHINHGASHSPPKNAGDGVIDLWSNPETPVENLIADIEVNRQWMNDNGLGAGAGLFGAPQGWWLESHEQYLKPYLYGRPRQGRGMGSYGLLTMWDENTEVRAACDTNLSDAYLMLTNNVGTEVNGYTDGDKAVQIDVWHHHESHANEGSLEDFKAYIDVVASHIAAGRLRAVNLKELYENYLYSETDPGAIEGDLDGDGVVNLIDFALMGQNWLLGTGD